MSVTSALGNGAFDLDDALASAACYVS